MIICYIDGACEPFNPGGNMGWGGWARDEEKVLFQFSGSLKASPYNSNNVAEYKALIELLQTYLVEYKKESIVIKSDSMLVVSQMNGVWRIKNGAYVPYAEKAKELKKGYKDISFKWIPRESNEEADKLSKKALPQGVVEKVWKKKKRLR